MGRVGLIGIGNIGAAVAHRLLEGGYEVIGYDERDMTAFAAAGGRPVASPRAVVERCDVVVHALPGAYAFETAVHGSAGTLPVLTSRHVVLDLSTYPLAFKRTQRDILAGVGAVLLDGEVTGTPTMVRDGSAVLLLAGCPEAVERVRPVCEAVTGIVRFVGPFGTAATLKLVNNLLSAVNALAAAEAMALGQRCGLPAQLLVEVLMAGAGNSVMLSSRAPLMVARQYRPASGRIGAMRNYLDLIPALSAEVRSATPLLDTAVAVYDEAIRTGRGDDDLAALVDVVEALPSPWSKRAADEAS